MTRPKTNAPEDGSAPKKLGPWTPAHERVMRDVIRRAPRKLGSKQRALLARLRATEDDDRSAS